MPGIGKTTRPARPTEATQRLELPTVPAQHNRVLSALIYRLLVRRSVWSHFDRVWLKIEGPLPHPADGPLIVYLNHPSWWDGYMAFLLSRAVLRDRFQPYLMMEERELLRYRFFAWCGCFSVDRQNPRAAARSMAYVGRMLSERRDRALWIFPQGEITPPERRPLAIYPGVAHAARRIAGATLCPVALRYEFRGEQRPEAFMRVGPLHRADAASDARALSAKIAQQLTVAVDALRDDLNAGQLADYRVLLCGRRGVNRVFDALRVWLPGGRDGAGH